MKKTDTSKKTKKQNGMQSIAFMVLSILSLAPFHLSAQSPVPVGFGSYASTVPGATPYQTLNIDAVTLYTNPGVRGPFPSNDWWTSILTSQYSYGLWAQPLDITATSTGLQIYMPNSWVNGMMNRTGAITIGGDSFAPSAANLKSWGDWTVTFSMPGTAGKNWDVTIGHGLPYVWIESTMMDLNLTMELATTYYDDAGTSLTGTYTGDHIGFSSDGKHYGLFAPPGTEFTLSSTTLTVHFTGSASSVVFAGMPNSASLSYFNDYSEAIPRNTKVTWTYDKTAGTVQAHWQIITEPLRGPEPKLIQGFIPHQYKDSPTLVFNGLEYRTARGMLKACTGTNFNISMSFIGIPIRLPAPEPIGLPNDFNRTRMSNYIHEFAHNDYAGGGYPNMFMVDPQATYWSGKKLQMFASLLAEAVEMRHPDKSIISNWLRTELENWYTYTPGELSRFFGLRPQFGALIGYWQDFASDKLIDVHFHYGMFLYATAIMGSVAPDFLQKYGPMARLVTRNIANWDRNDTLFPFMRTLDLWEGHSWAVGGWNMNNEGFGNNQESSSEAMNFWTGAFLLGTLMEDSEMQSMAAFGYATESRACQEYYFDWDNENFRPFFNKPVVGILRGGAVEFTTFFGSEPFKPPFIQKIPMTTGSYYQVENPAGAKQEWDAIRAILAGEIEGWSAQDFWAEYANVFLKWTALFDPEYTAAKYEQLWTGGHRIAHDKHDSPDAYFYIHANRILGKRQFNYHMDNPTGAVFYNTNTETYTFMVYNHKAVQETVAVYKDGAFFANMTVPAFTYKVTTDYLGPPRPLRVTATSPANGATNVPHSTSTISVTFTSNMNGTSVAAQSSITGPGVTGFTYLSGTGTKTITLSLVGTLQTNQTYSVLINSSALSMNGGTLVSNHSFTFRAVPPPPPRILRVESSTPANNATSVSSNLTQIVLLFTTNMNGTSVASYSTIIGEGVSGLTYLSGNGTKTITLGITGSVKPSKTYQVFISSNSLTSSGAQLSVNHTFSFKIQSPPLLTVPINDFNSTANWTSQVNSMGENVVHSPSGNWNLEASSQLYAFSTVPVSLDNYLNRDISAYDGIRIRMYAVDGLTASSVRIILNDGSDHQLEYSAYGTLTASYQDVLIPLADFGANLASAVYFRIQLNMPSAKAVRIDDISLVQGSAPATGPSTLRITGITPASGSTNIPVNTTLITMIFNSNMNGFSVASNASISGSGVSALNYQSGNGSPIITLAIAGTLQYHTTYSVTLNSNARSANGSRFADFTNFSFTTLRSQTPPPLSLISSLPADNAQNVPVSLSQIVLHFSTNMRTSGFSNATITGGLLIQGISGDGTDTVTLQISSPLSYSTLYTLVIPQNVKSTNGLSLQSSITLSFRTIAAQNEVTPVPQANRFIITPNPLVCSGAQANGDRIRITYAVESAAEIRFEIYTLLGDMVTQWKDEDKDGVTEWNTKNIQGTDVVSGIYFVLMRVNGKIVGPPVKLGVLR